MRSSCAQTMLLLAKNNIIKMRMDRTTCPPHTYTMCVYADILDHIFLYLKSSIWCGKCLSSNRQELTISEKKNNFVFFSFWSFRFGCVRARLTFHSTLYSLAIFFKFFFVLFARDRGLTWWNKYKILFCQDFKICFSYIFYIYISASCKFGHAFEFFFYLKCAENAVARAL